LAKPPLARAVFRVDCLVPTSNWIILKAAKEIHNVSRVRRAPWRRMLRPAQVVQTSEDSMSDVRTTPRTKVLPKTERPRLYKVILLNDDYTPREFVITVLKQVFRMSKDQAYRVMMTAHRRGVCVVAVYTKDIAESKATEGTDAGRKANYPLMFTTEPEQ
jgi:ATP-dependent Clp protease adaptor protein ClpS